MRPTEDEGNDSLPNAPRPSNPRPSILQSILDRQERKPCGVNRIGGVRSTGGYQELGCVRIFSTETHICRLLARTKRQVRWREPRLRPIFRLFNEKLF